MSGSSPRRSGRFITLEGPEGGGKTSQAERLRAAIDAAGREVVLTREPGGTVLGERVREILLERTAARLSPRTDALLFSAARAQLVADVIAPALERGAVVISTRYADSTLAYQGYGAGLPLAELRALEQFATGGLRPDLTVLLDLPVEAGLARKGSDERTRFEHDLDLEFHRRVRDGFLEIARSEPDRLEVVDATGPEAQVCDLVLAAAGRVVPELRGRSDTGSMRRGEPERPPVRIQR